MIFASPTTYRSSEHLFSAGSALVILPFLKKTTFVPVSSKGKDLPLSLAPWFHASTWKSQIPPDRRTFLSPPPPLYLPSPLLQFMSPKLGLKRMFLWNIIEYPWRLSGVAFFMIVFLKRSNLSRLFCPSVCITGQGRLTRRVVQSAFIICTNRSDKEYETPCHILLISNFMFRTLFWQF